MLREQSHSLTLKRRELPLAAETSFDFFTSPDILFTPASALLQIATVSTQSGRKTKQQYIKQNKKPSVFSWIRSPIHLTNNPPASKNGRKWEPRHSKSPAPSNCEAALLLNIDKISQHNYLIVIHNHFGSKDLNCTLKDLQSNSSCFHLPQHTINI